MSTFNQSSTYNRTFERKFWEEAGAPRLPSSSPLQHIKTTMGGLGADDLGLGHLGLGNTGAQVFNYNYGTTVTSGAFSCSDDYLSASIDLKAFSPEEIKVSIVGNQIVVEANQAEKQDYMGTIERHFKRKINLPRNAQPDTVQSHLSSEGMLTVTARAPKPKDNSPGRTIPIKIETSPGQAAPGPSFSTSQQASPAAPANGTTPQNGL